MGLCDTRSYNLNWLLSLPSRSMQRPKSKNDFDSRSLRVMLLTKNKIHFAKKTNGMIALGWDNVIVARLSRSYRVSTYRTHTTTNSIQTNFDATAAFSRCHSSIVRYILFRQESTDSTSVKSAGCVLKHGKIVHYAVQLNRWAVACHVFVSYAHRAPTVESVWPTPTIINYNNNHFHLLNEWNELCIFVRQNNTRAIRFNYVDVCKQWASSSSTAIAFVFKWWMCHFLVPFRLTAVRHHVSQDAKNTRTFSSMMPIWGIRAVQCSLAAAQTQQTRIQLTGRYTMFTYHNQISVMNFCVRHHNL